LEFNVSLQQKYGYLRDGLSQFIEDTGGPSVPVREFNLIACRKPDKLDKPAGGIEPHMQGLSASQAHCTAAQRTSPLSHLVRAICLIKKCFS